MLNVFFFKFRSNCKNFFDIYGFFDKGRGKSCFLVSTSYSRIQNVVKRSSVIYGYFQKKYKCLVYYSKYKVSIFVVSSVNIIIEEKQISVLGSFLFVFKEDVCIDVMGENWINFKYVSGINVNLQKNLIFFKNLLNKEVNILKNIIVVNYIFLECYMKEGIQICMFFKETDIKFLESVVEFKEQEFCFLKTFKKLFENYLSKSLFQLQLDLLEIFRKNNGNFFFF